MRVLPNYVYNFSFKSEFESLDGIYKVLGILSYEELLATGIDLIPQLYTPQSLTEVDFENDLTQIRTSQIFKLQSVDDEGIIQFLPEVHLKNVPDANVQQFLDLAIACKIGVHIDPDTVSTLRSEIQQVIEAMIGEAHTAEIYTVDKKWLTETEFQAIEAARAASITTVSNHYTESVALQLEVDRLRTLIAGYETTLINL